MKKSKTHHNINAKLTLTKKARKKANNKVVMFLIICVVFALLICYFLTVVVSALDYFGNETSGVANQFAAENAQVIKDNTAKVFDEVRYVAYDAAKTSGADNFTAFGQEKVRMNDYECLQFLNNDNIMYSFGASSGSVTYELLQNYIVQNRFGVSKIFTDNTSGDKCIAIYVPVENNAEINAVVAYCKLTSVIFDEPVHSDFLSYSCIADLGGEIYQSNSAEDFAVTQTGNFFSMISSLYENKTTVNTIQNDINKNFYTTYSITLSGTSYFVSLIELNDFGNRCFFVNIYDASELTQSIYPLYDHLMASAIGLAILAVFLFAAFIILWRRNRAQKSIFDEVDSLLGCNTFNKFLSEADDILSINRHSDYAVIYFGVERYSYVQSALGDDFLRYINTILNKTITLNEAYGHCNEDKFVMLLHYSSKQELSNRIKMLNMLCSIYDPAKENSIQVNLVIGVYFLDREKNYTVKQMYDRAVIAQNSHSTNMQKPYVVYDRSVRAKFLRESEIAARAEKSFANKEFRVFFQPKYNIQNDIIDSTEALVRWYDPSTHSYILPDDFIRVFELNKFIIKLDRYVFEEVCKYMKEAEERGEKVVPVSVNASRVTATEPDFLTHYIDTKKKYGIADGFLTIEFTESFAYENFEIINEIVTSLRKHGFGCSIDDFGTGYSSFSVLKQLHMDEIKLDKLFLDIGSEVQQDEFLIKSMISLGKNFKMKVVQEGIENKEQLKKLEEYGCDVIQGYFYSEPLALSDYIDFVNGDTTISGIVAKHLKK